MARGLREMFSTLKRHLSAFRSKWPRRYLLQSAPYYWRIKKKLTEWRNEVRRRQFQIVNKKQAFREKVGIAGSIASSVIWAAIAAVALGAGIAVAEVLLSGALPSAGQIFEKYRPDQGLYQTLSSSVVYIGGVFLGLYYTAVTGLVGSAYSNVPAEIRSLAARNEIGSIYSRFLAFTTAYGLVILTLPAVGLPRSPVNFLLLAGAALVAILSFIQVGPRTFDLYETAYLSSTLLSEVQEAIEAVREGPGKTDPSFQRSYQQYAESVLNTFATLAAIVRKQTELSQKPVVELTNTSLGLLVYYGTKKTSIPKGSEWFRKESRFPSWLTADHHEVDIALKTGTHIRASEERNYRWVEEALIDVIADNLIKLLEEGATQETYAIAHQLGTASEHLENLHAFEASQRVVDLSTKILSKFSGVGVDELRENERAYFIATCNGLASVSVGKHL